MAPLSESQRTNITLEWLFTRVSSGMNPQVALLGERRPASPTDIWTFSRVPAHMDGQAVLVREGLITHTALERLLSCVSALVDEQMVNS